MTAVVIRPGDENEELHGMSDTQRWEAHYASGGTSGPGSVGRHAYWKAAVVNHVVHRHRVGSVLEFGCGDGQQLAHYQIPNYLGLDVAPTAVQQCRQRFAADTTKSFQVYTPGAAGGLRAEMTMAVETLMHVLDDEAHAATLANMFAAASRFVLICDPLTELQPWDGPGWVKMRDLWPQLARFEGWQVTNIWRHPDVTEADRAAGVVGSMASDFVLLGRKER